MKNKAPDNQVSCIAVREIEAALDCANLLSFDLAIQAIEGEDYGRFADRENVKAFAHTAERGLRATGMISRLINNLMN